MKIAIISSVYEQTPPLRYGGIERVLDFVVKPNRNINSF